MSNGEGGTWGYDLATLGTKFHIQPHSGLLNNIINDFASIRDYQIKHCVSVS